MWEYITELGSEVVVTLVSFVTYLAVDRRLGARLVTLLSIAAVTNPILKNIFKMPRPPSHMFRVKASGYGFPSGHAQMSVSVWGYLSYRLYKLYRVRKKAFYAAASILTALITVLVCVSRVVLGVHWIHDVVGGAIFALISIAVVEYLAPRFASLETGTKLATLLLLAAAAAAAAYIVGAQETMYSLSLAVPFLAAYTLLDEEYKSFRDVGERFASLVLGLALLTAATVVYKSHVDVWVKCFAIAVCSGLNAYVVPIAARRLRSK